MRPIYYNKPQNFVIEVFICFSAAFAHSDIFETGLCAVEVIVACRNIHYSAAGVVCGNGSLKSGSVVETGLGFRTESRIGYNNPIFCRINGRDSFFISFSNYSLSGILKLNGICLFNIFDASPVSHKYQSQVFPSISANFAIVLTGGLSETLNIAVPSFTSSNMAT